MLLAAAHFVAHRGEPAVLRVHHVAHRAAVGERADRAERGHHGARLGRVVKAGEPDPERRAERAAAERPGDGTRAAVHRRVERGAAHQRVGDPGGEAEIRAPHAEQRRVEVKVVELGARRAGRAQRAQSWHGGGASRCLDRGRTGRRGAPTPPQAPRRAPRNAGRARRSNKQMPPHAPRNWCAQGAGSAAPFPPL